MRLGAVGGIVRGADGVLVSRARWWRLPGKRTSSIDGRFSFFFQAEDGIRDVAVTGVQTCALPILRSRLEIPIAVAQAEPAPNVGPPTGNAQAAHPKKRLVGRGSVRFIQVVDEPVGVVFAASESGLDRTSLAHDFRSHVAIFQLERGLVLGEILVGLSFAGFEESYVQSGFRQPFARPPARSAGAYNNDVVKAVVFLGIRSH